MISKKRRALTIALLKALVSEFDSIRTVSKILGLPNSTVHSWLCRGNISDKGLKIIANNPKTAAIYLRDEFAEIRNESWY